MPCNDEKKDTFHNFYKANIIQPLKGFCATVEEGCSLTRASEKLFLTPSAIVKQIQSLEDKLHIKLFRKIDSNRVNRIALELTEDGKAFYKKAREIIEKTEALIEEFSDEIDKKNSKTLNISINICVFQKIIFYIDEFRKKHKNLKINIIFQERQLGFESLLNDSIDLFISSLENGETIPFKMNFIELTKYIPYWVFYKGHSLENKNAENITKEDILKNTFIYNKNNISMTSLNNFFKDNNIKSAISFEECDMEMEKKLIQNKMCIWLIFNIFLNEDEKKYFVFKNAENFFPTGKYGCFIKRDVSKKEILKEFIEFLDKNKKEIYNFDFLRD